MTHPSSDAARNDAGALAYGVRPPGFRLPDATRVSHVVLQVADLGRSVEYYERVLGFRARNRSDTTATLVAHGDSTPLIELHERRGARSVPRHGRLGLYHFAILLPTRAALGQFVAHLAQIGEYAGMSDHLVSEALYLTDPDGLGIEVYADRPRATWQTAERQIVMQTEPLDVDDLVRAGGGRPWTGMPPGTVIGHVHLFVADLDAATGFYHAGLGFDKTVWNYPGALFLSAGGYHHHLGTNTWAAHAPRAEADDARLVEWVIVVPDHAAVQDSARSMQAAGHPVTATGDGWIATDPWGTQIHLVSGDGR
jgi:catechol 2,3-dioxygenase